ncbi:enoyl-CoA hydratase/isomerase family protein [Natronolimnohabitans innermongolicus]|uniref:Enoyl-CoA hydratase/isomerase n=1 Tax=Natronolimnohabitans innermongolicus JCM 12255 TaxID=1227499 RepID=L9WLW6_9EURY|nr:enoyl-CoA hydratase/isomerase family protein [Natronolimnohabitans innermongolicus]ELY50460.1 enoyl-CoA hydratase/isomerase [Natronolimnohabitans innermongolicus JCM 12255]
MYEDISYETDEGIATITIERPDVYNAFRQQTIAELNVALRDATDDDGVYVILVTGAGDGFCAGADVSEMPNWHEDMSKEDYAGYLWGVQNVVRQLRTTDKPSIAAVGGPAIGAGCDFALACDFRIVGDDAVLREGFVRVGLVPGDGGGWLLPRLIGEAKAKEYLLTGKDITPEDAVDLGLAVELADDPVGASRALAEDLLDLPATAVRRTNRLVDWRNSFEDYCKDAIEHQWECVNDDEHHEAIAAFQEKRDPEYDREYSS